MRTRVMLLGAALAAAPFAAQAVPVLYNTTYTATTGPSGTGSFVFDNDDGSLTGMVWDFGGGIVGGVTVPLVNVFGDTAGRFLFEILSETDVHTSNIVGGSTCINVACSSTFSQLSGIAPNGATLFRIVGTLALGSSDYAFLTGGGPVPQSTVASGTIRIAAQVPEPATLSLLAAGLLGLLGLRRRRAPAAA